MAERMQHAVHPSIRPLQRRGRWVDGVLQARRRGRRAASTRDGDRVSHPHLAGYDDPRVDAEPRLAAVGGPEAGEGLEQRMAMHKLSLQAGAYQNSTWVVAVAKCGDEDGHPLMGGTVIVDPDGVIQLMEISCEGVGRNAEELVRKIKAAIYVREHPGQVCPANWEERDETLAPTIDLVGKI